MKKMISVLSALTIALTAIPAYAYAKQSDEPEMYELAYSLGADKDYLSIINYSHNEERPLNKECYADFLSKCSIIEAAYSSEDIFKAISSGGLCMGIAMIEVLSHNGIISPSDLKDGVTYLKALTDFFRNAYIAVFTRIVYEFVQQIVQLNTLKSNLFVAEPTERFFVYKSSSESLSLIVLARHIFCF